MTTLRTTVSICGALTACAEPLALDATVQHEEKETHKPPPEYKPPDLQGAALLWRGIYLPKAPSLQVGRPQRLQALPLTDNGVDLDVCATLQWKLPDHVRLMRTDGCDAIVLPQRSLPFVFEVSSPLVAGGIAFEGLAGHVEASPAPYPVVETLALHRNLPQAPRVPCERALVAPGTKINWSDSMVPCKDIRRQPFVATLDLAGPNRHVQTRWYTWYGAPFAAMPKPSDLAPTFDTFEDFFALRSVVFETTSRLHQRPCGVGVVLRYADLNPSRPPREDHYLVWSGNCQETGGLHTP